MKTTVVLLPGLNGTTGLFEPLMRCADDQVEFLPISYPTHKKLIMRILPLSLFVAAKKPQGLLGVVLVASFGTAPNKVSVSLLVGANCQVLR